MLRPGTNSSRLRQLPRSSQSRQPISTPSINAASDILDEFPTLRELEKRHVFAALDRCKGNRANAARLLAVSSRTLRNKLHEYNGTLPRSGDDKTVKARGNI